MSEYTGGVADLITKKVPILHNALSKKSYTSVWAGNSWSIYLCCCCGTVERLYDLRLQQKFTSELSSLQVVSVWCVYIHLPYGVAL